MPLTALRIFPGTGDRAENARTDIVRWTVPTREKAAAYAAEGIPQSVGEQHPDDPGLRLDKLTDDTDGANTEITGYYSTDQRFSTRFVVGKVEGWYKSAPISVKKTTVDIPLNTRDTETVPGIDGGPGRDIEVWKSVVIKRELKMRRYRIDVYTKIADTSLLDLHSAMIDHLHTIRGHVVRFEGMTNYKEEGGGFYTLTYEWEEDPGTEWPEPRETGDSVFLSPDNRATDARLLRLPYEQLFATRSIDPENVPISTISVQYPSDLRRPSEWRTLPGMPPL